MNPKCQLMHAEIETQGQAGRYGETAPKARLLIYPECPDTFWSFKHTLTFLRK